MEKFADVLSGALRGGALNPQPDQPQEQPRDYGMEGWQQAALMRNRGQQQYGALPPSSTGYAMPQGQQPNARELAAFTAQQQAAQRAGAFAAPDSTGGPTSSAGGYGQTAPRGQTLPTTSQMYGVQQWLRSPAGQQWAQTDYGKSEIARRSWQSLL